MLFAEASNEKVTVIEDVLLRFCDSSGQKISKHKSLVYLSRNVEMGSDLKLSKA